MENTMGGALPLQKVSLPEHRCCESYKFLQPSRPVLVTTINKDGSTHVAPFSWVTPISGDPPYLCLALLTKPKKQHTLENIENVGEFVINTPDLELADQLVLCSYKVKPDTKKIELAGFATAPATKVKPRYIEKCRAHLECRVLSTHETGDHTLIIAKVIYVSYQEKAYTDALLLKLEEFMPCIHLDHYSTKNGQVHLFLSPCGLSLSEVPFVER